MSFDEPTIGDRHCSIQFFGFLLDQLSVSRRLWAAIYLVASVALFTWSLLSFPSLERAIAKNGSLSAYAFCAANLGLYASVSICLGGGVLVWFYRRFRSRKGS